nr:threonine/serine exporter family protein [Acidipropionibacterium timonense]
MTVGARDDREFIDDTEAVVRLGSMLLASGTGSYRVKRAMERAASALGMERHDASVSLTEIMVTAHRGDNFRTVVREVYRVKVDAARIAALEHVSRHLPEDCTAEHLEAELDRVSRTVTPVWKPWQNTLAGGVACAGFAILNRFSPLDALVVLVAASAGQDLRRRLAHRWLNQFGVAALAAALASLVYLVIVALLDATGLPLLRSVNGPGYVASLLFLVPGFPMITSILDMARLDFTAGLSRATYSLGLVIAATLSAWVMSFATGMAPLPTQFSLPGAWQWIAFALATFLGVAGFAVLFNSTAPMVLVAALLGMIGNLCRLGLGQAGMPNQLAAGVGGLVIGLMAAPLAPRLHLPRITLTVPACVIMVPGAAMYRMMYWLNGRDVSQALGFGADAVLTVVSISAGLAVARMLTDPHWAFAKPIPSPHAFRSRA